MTHPERALRILVASPDDPGAARVVTAGQVIAAIRAAFGHRMPRRPHLPGGVRHWATPQALRSLLPPGASSPPRGLAGVHHLRWGGGRSAVPARVIDTWQIPN
jgi:hypothetical protein